MSKNTHLLSPGGVKGVQIFPQFSKMGKNTHIMPFWTFSNIKYLQNTLKTKINKYFFQINKKTAGDIPIYGHPGGQNTNF